MTLPDFGDRELTMRTMKYGSELEVVDSWILRDKIKSIVSETSKLPVEQKPTDRSDPLHFVCT